MQEERSQVNIDRIDKGTGWVCFQAGNPSPSPQQLPGLLHHSLFTWLQRNPEFKVRATLPIVEDANTVAIHVWFD